MSSISIIGSGNMASAIGALAVKGGNAVEVIGRNAAKAAALARALGNGATAGTWGAAPAGEIVILAVLLWPEARSRVGGACRSFSCRPSAAVRGIRPRVMTCAAVCTLARVLGESAVVASRTNSFLGERYRRIAKRRGKKRAIVAVGRSILVIVWHLLSDDHAVFNDLGTDHFTRHVNSETKKHNHIRQLEALGYTVTLTPAA
jgi:hypothetical protein